LAKAAIAAVTAAVTMTVAGGATGVLPLPGGHADTPASIQSTIQQAIAQVPTSVAVSGNAGTGTGTATPSVGVSAAAHTTTSSGNSQTTAAATATATPQVSVPTSVPLPTLPALPACVKDLIPAKGTTIDPTTFITKLKACIQSLIAAHLPKSDVQGMFGSANFPTDIASCLSSLIGSMPGLPGVSGLPGAAGSTGSTTVAAGTTSTPAQILAACMPTGSFPGVGSLPGLGSLPTKGATTTHTSGK
jgi:hypothetical protein